MTGIPQVDSLFTAVLHCSLYSDERDAIIARWNMLQVDRGKRKRKGKGRRRRVLCLGLLG